MVEDDSLGSPWMAIPIFISNAAWFGGVLLKGSSPAMAISRFNTVNLMLYIQPKSRSSYLSMGVSDSPDLQPAWPYFASRPGIAINQHSLRYKRRCNESSF